MDDKQKMAEIKRLTEEYIASVANVIGGTIDEFDNASTSSICKVALNVLVSSYEMKLDLDADVEEIGA